MNRLTCPNDKQNRPIATRKKAHQVIVILAAATLLAGCSRSTSSREAESQQTPSQPDASEARKWLASGKCSIGEYTPEVSLAHVEELYRRGAVAVKAVDIKSEEDGQWTDKLVVELPGSADNRKRLFEIEAELSRLTGEFEPEGDNGQKKLLLWYEASGPNPPGTSEGGKEK